MRGGAKAGIAVAVLVVGSLAAAWQAAAHEHQDPVEVEVEYEIDPEEGEASGSAEVFMHDLTGFVPLETELTLPVGRVGSGAAVSADRPATNASGEVRFDAGTEGELFPGETFIAEAEGQVFGTDKGIIAASAESEGELDPGPAYPWGDQFVAGVEGEFVLTGFGTFADTSARAEAEGELFPGETFDAEVDGRVFPGETFARAEAEGSASEAGVEDLDLYAEADESDGVLVCSDGTVADQKVAPCAYQESPIPPDPGHPLP